MTELSEALLSVMREAASKTLIAGERFITPRFLLLALLDQPEVGPSLCVAVSRDRLEARAPEHPNTDGAPQLPEERGATLAFQTTDGGASVWLDKDALDIFAEGVDRAGHSQYEPRHLALGMAAEAKRRPLVFTAMQIDAGALVDAIYKL